MDRSDATKFAATKFSAEAKQHVDFYRKYLLRKRMLRWAVDGAAYVPFIGDGDLAVELYQDRMVYGADLDQERVDMALTRLAKAEIKVADCDLWTFPGLTDPIAIADFDAYVDPYAGFLRFWAEAPKQDRMVMFFTDGRRQGMMRTGFWTKPDGTKVELRAGSLEKVKAFHFYWAETVMPWFTKVIGPDWRILEQFRYLRSMMLYGGFAVEKSDR